MGVFIGHKNIVESFSDRCKKGKLSHAHLIVGPDGIGKSKLAKLFASQIIGIDPSKDNIDIVKFYPKKDSFGVDEVRELISEVGKKPFEGDEKVLIIYKGSKMTTQAQNALLKTIEEPPKGVYIILLCEELESILDTIKSRCQIYKLSPLKMIEMDEYINRLNTYNDDEKKAAIAFAQGIPGKAEQFLVDEKIKSIRNVIIKILNYINNNKLDEILTIENELISQKDNKEIIFELMTSFIRDILIAKEIDDSRYIINSDKYEDIKKLAIDLSFNKLNKILEKIKEAQKNINSNSNFAVAIRVMLIGFMEG